MEYLLSIAVWSGVWLARLPIGSAKLVRRASLDLLGLLPHGDERSALDEFKVLGGILASPTQVVETLAANLRVLLLQQTLVGDGRTVPASTPLSLTLSKALKAKGFKFVGAVTVYAFMQAVGMVNDHGLDCPRREACMN